MKVCLALALMLAACASSEPATLDRSAPAPAAEHVRDLAPLDGSKAESALALGENLMTLMERATDARDAIEDLDRYCAEQRAAIDAVIMYAREHIDDDAYLEMLAAHAHQQRPRHEAFEAARPEIYADPGVEAAVTRCMTPTEGL